MISLPGYILEEIIHENKSLRIYRGHTVADQLPVIIKALKNETSNALDSAKVMHEYRITRDLDSKGIAKPLRLEGDEISLALVMEDIHRNKVVHGDLKESNILIQPDKGIVKTIDFSSAILVDEES